MPTETFGPDPFFWTYIIVSGLIIAIALFLITKPFWENRWLMEKINAQLAGKGRTHFVSGSSSSDFLFAEVQTRQKLKFITQEQEASDISSHVMSILHGHGIRGKCSRTSAIIFVVSYRLVVLTLDGSLHLLDNKADGCWANSQAVKDNNPVRLLCQGL